MKILIIHTRSLCYFSAGFFLDRMEEALENLGNEVIRLDMNDEDETFETMDSLNVSNIDAVFDINSKLPYIVNENGDFWLDTLKAPFFNYILDHPLYHHRGLIIPIKNYHAICIDRYHCSYIDRFYKHIKTITYLPVAGSESVTDIPFEKRSDEVLFCGTHFMKKQLEGELSYLFDAYGNTYKHMIYDLMDCHKPYEEPLEECLSDYLRYNKKSIEDFPFVSSFAELMNLIFPVDRLIRNDIRERILFEFANAAPLVIMGDGWEETNPAKAGAIIKESQFYGIGIEQNSRYKYVLDINPAFLSGFHDRSANGLANGACVISNLSPDEKESPKDGRDIIFYKGDRVDIAIEKLEKYKDKAEEIGRNGKSWLNKNLSWQTNAMRLQKLISC